MAEDSGERDDLDRSVNDGRSVDDGRRGLLKLAAAGGIGASLIAAGLPLQAFAQESNPDWIPKVAAGGKKVRIGIPLGYGAYNQPWRRGCWRAIKKVLELGAERVTLRGQPSKKSEQEMERALLDRKIDALLMGIYSGEEESAYIAKEAHKRGIKTVGFAVNVVDSPAVIEDSFGTSLKLGYYMQDVLQRQGTVVQTAENPGFYLPFDMEVALMDLIVKYQPKMKMLQFLPGGLSTQDETAISRKNVTALLEANPKKGSINALVSWWWPDTVGAAQAIKRMNRTEIKVFNHYFSDQFLGDWASGQYDIAASTDTPWTDIGDKAAEIAVAMARGENVPPRTYHVPVRFITTPKEAGDWQKQLKSWDLEAIKLLKQYGG